MMKELSTEYSFVWKNDTTVVCELKMPNNGHVFKGVAKFHPEEVESYFNEKVGMRIAFVRAQKKAFKWEKKMLERELKKMTEVIAQADSEIVAIDESNILFRKRLERSRSRMKSLKL
ncbi:MAG: hypothetical protein ACRCZZ_04085 [Phocaeicola sp.]